MARKSWGKPREEKPAVERPIKQAGPVRPEKRKIDPWYIDERKSRRPRWIDRNKGWLSRD